MKLFKVRPDGRPVLIAKMPANSVGNARFVVPDSRTDRRSTYIAHIGETIRTLPDWTQGSIY